MQQVRMTAMDVARLVLLVGDRAETILLDSDLDADTVETIFKARRAMDLRLLESETGGMDIVPCVPAQTVVISNY